jgi:hypothetical protein
LDNSYHFITKSCLVFRISVLDISARGQFLIK